MVTLLFFQLSLLAYHQLTTLVDLYPFNGACNYTWKERLAECGVNGFLMLLPPIGFGFQIRALMIFGIVYYFILFAVELTIWWVPYLTWPSGRWLRIYNRLLAVATSDFERGNVLARWQQIYNRLHRGTITVLPDSGDRIVPNLEHMILQAWKLITAFVTAIAYFCRA